MKNIGILFMNLVMVIYGKKNLRNNVQDWTTNKNSIYLNNKIINIKGITWNGFQSENFVLLGLWKHSIEFYLDKIKYNGFNAIRIPYSSEFIYYNSEIIPNYKTIEKDLELKNKTSLQILDLLFEKTEKKNILVTLNLNRLHKDYTSGIWNDNKTFTNEIFLNSWYTLLDRYKDRKNLFAIDIFEQPSGNYVNFCNNDPYDWKNFSQYFMQKIQDRYPDKKWLFFVQGINHNDNFLNLKCDYSQSLMNRIVFTPHLWNQFQNMSIKSQIEQYYNQWDQNFGFLATNNTVMITKASSDDFFWMSFLKDYLIQNKLNNIFLYNLEYSSINGILEENWSDFDNAKLNIIDDIQPNSTTIIL